MSFPIYFIRISLIYMNQYWLTMSFFNLGTSIHSSFCNQYRFSLSYIGDTQGFFSKIGICYCMLESILILYILILRSSILLLLWLHVYYLRNSLRILLIGIYLWLNYLWCSWRVLYIILTSLIDYLLIRYLGILLRLILIRVVILC